MVPPTLMYFHQYKREFDAAFNHKEQYKIYKTFHVDVWNNFLPELKDQGLLIIKYIPRDMNGTDIFYKECDISGV